MYAVIKTGGKQYRVSKDDVVTIERVAGDAGAKVEFDQVLMLGSGADVTFGAPIVSGARVIAELVEHSRGPKLIAFKKRRRKNSRRKKGHRQDLSIIRIMDVLGAGQKASERAHASEGKPAAPSRQASSAHAARPFKALDKAENGKPDDLSLIGGVGPKLEEELHKAGIFHFWQVAGLSADDVEALEANSHIGHRVTREEWVAQAQELLDGKPPRAKTDRDRAGT
jgi:large subunit ribosomal protein L21